MKPFEQYLRLLLDLHRLMQNGNGDGSEADVIRDKMDGPWRLLSPVQELLLSKISEELYK